MTRRPPRMLARTLAACAVVVALAADRADAQDARGGTAPTSPADAPAGSAPADPVRIANPSRAEGDGLVATAEVAERAVEVGRAIIYRIEWRGPAAAGARVDLDAFREAAAKGDPFAFDLLESTALRRADVAGASEAAWSMELVLSTFDAGLATPPPLAISWRAGGAERRIELPLPSIEVASLVGADAEPADYRDIAGEIEPAPDAGAWWLWPIGAFAVTTVAAAGLALWLRRDRVAVPADRRAIAALEALAARDLPRRREFGAFADELVGILRAFTIERFAIPADRRTTRELLAHLDGHAEVAAAELERLRALLALADRVKFARTEPETAECAAHLLDARRFVEACAAAARAMPAPVVDAAGDGEAEVGRAEGGPR